MTNAENTELVDMLEHVWGSMAELGASLDETEWKAPTECPGWTVQDNLVHITALERFILGDPLPSEDLPDDLPHVKNDVGRSNERWIESRRAWTGADALAEFVATTGTRASPSSGSSTTTASPPTRGRPMGPGTVAGAARLPHLRLVGARTGHAARPSSVPATSTPPAARFSTEMMLDVLPYVVGKKVGAPDGSTVVLTLTGPIVLDRGGGRHRRSCPPARRRCPTSRPSAVTLASDVYGRLACGRLDPDEAVVTGVGGHRGRRRAGRRARAPAQLHVLNHPHPPNHPIEGELLMDLVTNVVTGSNADRLLLLLHGYGADERDLGGLLGYLDPERHVRGGAAARAGRGAARASRGST